MLERLRTLFGQLRSKVMHEKTWYDANVLPPNTVSFSFDPEFSADGWHAHINVYAPDGGDHMRPIDLYFSVEEYLMSHELHARYKHLGNKIVIYGGEMHSTEII